MFFAGEKSAVSVGHKGQGFSEQELDLLPLGLLPAQPGGGLKILHAAHSEPPMRSRTAGGVRA